MFTASSPKKMNELCQIIEECLNKFKLQINLDKSEIIIYNSRNKLKIFINNQNLKVSNHYKNLGFKEDSEKTYQRLLSKDKSSKLYTRLAKSNAQNKSKEKNNYCSLMIN